MGLEYSQPRVENCRFVLQTHATQAQVVYGSILNRKDVQQCGRDFDVITCFDVLEHVRSVPKAISAFAYLLKPGGYVVATMGNKFFPEYLLREPH